MPAVEVWKILAAQGAGLLALFMVGIFFYKLASQFGGPFLEAQKSQAAAMQAQADAMRDMKDAVSGYITRDNNDHRELLIGFQVVAKEVKELSEIVRSQNQPALAGEPKRLSA